MPKKGYSRNTIFGRVNHYDSTGKKTGESRRGILDNEWIHYDEKGKRVAVTRNSIFGGTYTTDTHGKRIGYSRDNLWGGTNYYDTHGHLVGRSRDNIFGGSTDSEGFANQTSTRSASHKAYYYDSDIDEDEDEEADEDEEFFDQQETSPNNSLLGCSLFVIIFIIILVALWNFLAR